MEKLKQFSDCFLVFVIDNGVMIKYLVEYLRIKQFVMIASNLDISVAKVTTRRI